MAGKLDVEVVVKPSEWEPASWTMRPHQLRRGNWAQPGIVTLRLIPFSNKGPRELDHEPKEQACHAPAQILTLGGVIPALGPRTCLWIRCLGGIQETEKSTLPFPQKDTIVLGAGQKTQIGRISHGPLSPPHHSVAILDTIQTEKPVLMPASHPSFKSLGAAPRVCRLGLPTPSH